MRSLFPSTCVRLDYLCPTAIWRSRKVIHEHHACHRFSPSAVEGRYGARQVLAGGVASSGRAGQANNGESRLPGALDASRRWRPARRQATQGIAEHRNEDGAPRAPFSVSASNWLKERSACRRGQEGTGRQASRRVCTADTGSPCRAGAAFLSTEVPLRLGE